MGQRKYPPLTPDEVIAILLALGFIFKRQVGSHRHYQRDADAKRARAIVTVDTSDREFDDFLIKSMIEQSKHSRNEFYGATKRSAKKASVKYAG